MIANKKSWYSINLLLDLLLLNLIFLISAMLAQSWGTLLHKQHMFSLQFALNVFWYFSSRITDLYENVSTHNLSANVIVVLKNVIVQSIISVFFIFAVKENLFTRNFIIYYFLLMNIAIMIRIIFIKALKKRIRVTGKYLRNLLIVGNNKTGNDFLTFVKSHPELGYSFVGFVDHTKEGDVISSFDELDSILKKEKIEEAVVSLPNSETEKLRRIISICNNNAVRVHIIPDYFQFLSKKFVVGVLGNFPIITVRDEPLVELQWRFVKRAFDIIFSMIVIALFLWWLIPIIGLLIKITSSGPIFFNQDRLGFKDKKFSCYKFRTMYTGKRNPGDHFQPTIQDDPRVTKVGKLLRKSNLDEIPQFLNVLLGDMSVVGPRPHAIAYHEEYVNYFAAIKLRHTVKPGLTGWAQVNGLRGDVRDEEENKKRTIKRIEYDLWYIENWSFSLDIQIILLTVWQMLTRNTQAH